MSYCHAERTRTQASRHVTPNLLHDWVFAWFVPCENSCFSSLPAAGSDEGGETSCFGSRIKAFPEVEKLWTGKDETSVKKKKKKKSRIVALVDLETQRSPKRTLNWRISNFKQKISIERFQNYLPVS